LLKRDPSWFFCFGYQGIRLLICVQYPLEELGWLQQGGE